MLKDNQVDTIKNTIAIRDVVQALGGLGLDGKLQGNCPTGHDSKGGQCFSINTKGNYFLCFHCGKGGDVIDLVKLVENKTFPEALAWFKDNFNINGQGHKVVEVNPVDKEKLKELYAKNILYDLVFQKGKELLYTDKGKVALDYLTDIRGYAIENLKQTDWIYFPKDSEIRDYLLKQHPEAKEQISKLSLQGAGGDRFRLAFPYKDRDGLITGFVKRATEAKGISWTEREGKINTDVRWDSTTGLTKDDLFNLCNCKDYKELIICEGYPDALYLPTLGLKNIVAIGQGSLGAKHVDGLKALGIEKVTICFDNDETGIKNTKIAVEKLKDTGIKVYTLNPTLMGDHKDPDEFIKANGIEAFMVLCQQAELHTSNDKSNKAGDPVTEETKSEPSGPKDKSKNQKTSEFDKHKEQVNAILSKHDLNTDIGKKSALRESETYIKRITNPSIAGALWSMVNTESKQKRRVETMSNFIEREKQKTPYIVSGGILPSQGYLLVAGETGVGKSTLAWQLCNCMLSGKPFFDFKILADDTHIMYLNLENSDYSVDKLLKAQLTEYDLTTTQMDRLIIPDTTDLLLDSKPDIDFIKNSIKDYHIEVIVIDPITFSTNDDPYDYKTVTKYVKRLKKIRNPDNEEISWILLHHYNKPGIQKNNPLHRIMGSSGWGNCATSIMTLERYAESRNPYYKRLDFVKLRDEKVPEYKLIAINDKSRCFDIVEESTISKILPDKVIEILKEHGKPMQYKELVFQVEFKNGISDRHAKRLVKQAVEQKLIAVNNGLYSLILP